MWEGPLVAIDFVLFERRVAKHHQDKFPFYLPRYWWPSPAGGSWFCTSKVSL